VKKFFAGRRIEAVKGEASCIGEGRAKAVNRLKFLIGIEDDGGGAGAGIVLPRERWPASAALNVVGVQTDISPAGTFALERAGESASATPAMAAAPMLETFKKSRRVDSLDMFSPEKDSASPRCRAFNT
jgi:hypothetical protein